MQNRRIKVSLEDVRDIMAEKLSNGGEILYSPKGISMLPFIREGRDTVTLKKCDRDYKPGDMVFYRRPEGAFVLHRVIRVQKDGKYTMCGDNQSVLEADVDRDAIIAIVCGLKRGEKEVNLNGLTHKIYVKLLFLRRFYIRCSRTNVLKAVLRKIKKLLKKRKDGE